MISKFDNRKFISEFFLLILSVFLFVFSHPNFVFNDGLGFLAFLIYFPLLQLIKIVSAKRNIFFGFLYGFFCYCLFGFWLKNYDFIIFILVCFYQAVLYSVLFYCLKKIQLSFSNSFLYSFLLIISFEYLKTLGFLGFSYGITAYSQWKNVFFIQIASVIGVYGINFLVIFPSVLSSFFIDKKVNQFKFYFCCICWILIIASCNIYGFFKIKNQKFENVIKIAAIQHNEDSWQNGLETYQNNIKILMQLTDEALLNNPDIKIVVWPETAVVPSIIYNYSERYDEKRYQLVLDLLNYINKKNVIFVIGNAHQIKQKNGVQRYVSALIFDKQSSIIPPEPQIYSKIHLVPVSEFLPVKNAFYNFRMKHGIYLWNKGSEYKVFNADDFKFSTPICFEDTFTKICRKLAKNGAECFINLSNDSWSKSLVCQKQHLSMAVFRSIENGIPSIRSTTSGQSCMVLPSGKIENEISAFSKGYLVADVPVIKNRCSVYSYTGDLFGIIPFITLILLLITKKITVIIRKTSRNI